MNRDQALAELERMYNRPTSRARVWDALALEEREAISRIASGRTSVTVTEREHMTREQFERCWYVLERFARLATRIVAANDNARAEEQEQARALVSVAQRGAA